METSREESPQKCNREQKAEVNLTHSPESQIPLAKNHGSHYFHRSVEDHACIVCSSSPRSGSKRNQPRLFLLHLCTRHITPSVYTPCISQRTLLMQVLVLFSMSFPQVSSPTSVQSKRSSLPPLSEVCIIHTGIESNEPPSIPPPRPRSRRR